MNDVGEISSETNIVIVDISPYRISIHSYDKRMIHAKLIKRDNMHQSRFGITFWKLHYTVSVKWITTDYNVWNDVKLNFFKCLQV